MKKINKIILSSVVLVILLSGSFILGSKITINNGNKVEITKERYELFSKLDRFQDIVDEYYLFDEDEKEMKNSLYKGFFKGLGDPYTEYFSKEEYSKFMESSSGEYSGIGIYISVTDDNQLKVVSPIKGSPAYKAGLKPNDIITKINGDSYLGDQLEEATSVMKGKPGTEVNLGIRRLNKNNEQEDIEVKITIDIVELKTIESSKIDNLGYIYMSQFGEKTFTEFEQAYNSLKDDNVKGIILDLRNNPGGNKDICEEIADFLLPEGIIVKTVDKNGKEMVTKSDKKEENLPLVVLVNNSSASASEILSGAIKDYKKGIIVGETTYGKGLVQSLMPMKKLGIDDDGALKITIQEYFTPKGNKINELGVTPDEVVELPEGIIEFGPEHMETDTQLKKAIEILE